MDTGTLEGGSGAVLTVEGEASICTVAAIRERMLPALVCGDLTLDLTEADGFDTAMVQLILCAGLSASRSGSRLTVETSSDELRSVACRSGFDLGEYLTESHSRRRAEASCSRA